MGDRFDASDHIERGANLINLRDASQVKPLDKSDIEAELAEVEARRIRLLSELSKRDPDNGSVSISKAARWLMKDVDDVRCGRKISPVIPTAWPSLTEAIKGYPCGHITIWAARPAMGKSCAMEWEAVEQARQGRGVIFVTLEMTIPDLLLRIGVRDARRARIGIDIYDKDKSTDDDQVKFNDALIGLSDLPIEFIGCDGDGDDGPRTWTEIKDDLERTIATWKHDVPPRVVILDWLKEVDVSDQKRHRKHPHEVVVMNIRNWIKVRRSMVFLLVHALSRPSKPPYMKENWKAPRPELTALREVGMLDFYANCVILIYRPEKGDSNNDAVGIEECEFVIAKARNAQGAYTPMVWDYDKVCFVEPIPAMGRSVAAHKPSEESNPYDRW